MKHITILGMVGSLSLFLFGLGCGRSDDAVSYVKNNGSYCLPEAESRTEDCFIGGPEGEIIVAEEKLFGIEEVCESRCDKIRALTVADTSGLKNLKAFRGIEVTHSAAVRRNEDMLSTEGLDLRSGIVLQVKKNPSLKEITGLGDVTTASWIDIRRNPHLSTIEGLGELEELYNEVGGRENASNLVVQDTTMESLDQLDGLKFNPKSTLGIRDNDNLEEMPRLSGSLMRGISIEGNQSLKDVSGVAGIERMTGLLEIQDNPNLKSCDAQRLTEEIDFGEKAEVRIRRNGSGNCSE